MPAALPRIDLADLDAPSLLRWIKQEQPVSSRDDDRFGMAGRAQRILTALRSAERQTVGITGAFGSGKSDRATPHAWRPGGWPEPGR